MLPSAAARSSSFASFACSYCGQPNARNRCARCAEARYCNRNCQLKHWKEGHKRDCTPATSTSPSRIRVDQPRSQDASQLLQLPDEAVYLDADPTRIEQVLSNLLNNAGKYSDDGSPIQVKVERDGHEVVITVSDLGVGIDAQLLPRIFELFVQESRTLERKRGGLGIGLTLAERLVKLHGGSIEAKSAGIGHGADFSVRLPMLMELKSAGLEKLPAAPAKGGVKERTRRILIVDDNEDSACSLALLHERRGHETRIAFTGPDAVAAAAEFLPEVVILDVGLPGMNGFEVARRIRALPGLADALLVAMSGYGSEEDLAEGKRAGFNEYLVKPVDLKKLREWIR